MIHKKLNINLTLTNGEAVEGQEWYELLKKKRNITHKAIYLRGLRDYEKEK